MTFPPGVWLLIGFVVALFMFKAVRLGIDLQRDPFLLAGMVAIVLLALLVKTYQDHGVSPLEKVDVCTPPATAWPRAPQPTANLAGCPGYNAPVITAHDIPETQAPRGGFPVPSP